MESSGVADSKNNDPGQGSIREAQIFSKGFKNKECLDIVEEKLLQFNPSEDTTMANDNNDKDSLANQQNLFDMQQILKDEDNIVLNHNGPCVQNLPHKKVAKMDKVATQTNQKENDVNLSNNIYTANDPNGAREDQLTNTGVKNNLNNTESLVKDIEKQNIVLTNKKENVENNLIDIYKFINNPSTSKENHMINMDSTFSQHGPERSIEDHLLFNYIDEDPLDPIESPIYIDSPNSSKKDTLFLNYVDHDFIQITENEFYSPKPIKSPENLATKIIDKILSSSKTNEVLFVNYDKPMPTRYSQTLDAIFAKLEESGAELLTEHYLPEQYSESDTEEPDLKIFKTNSKENVPKHKKRDVKIKKSSNNRTNHISPSKNVKKVTRKKPLDTIQPSASSKTKKLPNKDKNKKELKDKITLKEKQSKKNTQNTPNKTAILEKAPSLKKHRNCKNNNYTEISLKRKRTNKNTIKTTGQRHNSKVKVVSNVKEKRDPGNSKKIVKSDSGVNRKGKKGKDLKSLKKGNIIERRIKLRKKYLSEKEIKKVIAAFTRLKNNEKLRYNNFLRSKKSVVENKKNDTSVFPRGKMVSYLGQQRKKIVAKMDNLESDISSHIEVVESCVPPRTKCFKLISNIVLNKSQIFLNKTKCKDEVGYLENKQVLNNNNQKFGVEPKRNLGGPIYRNSLKIDSSKITKVYVNKRKRPVKNFIDISDGVESDLNVDSLKAMKLKLDKLVNKTDVRKSTNKCKKKVNQSLKSQKLQKKTNIEVLNIVELEPLSKHVQNTKVVTDNDNVNLIMKRGRPSKYAVVSKQSFKQSEVFENAKVGFAHTLESEKVTMSAKAINMEENNICKSKEKDSKLGDKYKKTEEPSRSALVGKPSKDAEIIENEIFVDLEHVDNFKEEFVETVEEDDSFKEEFVQTVESDYGSDRGSPLFNEDDDISETPFLSRDPAMCQNIDYEESIMTTPLHNSYFEDDEVVFALPIARCVSRPDVTEVTDYYAKNGQNGEPMYDSIEKQDEEEDLIYTDLDSIDSSHYFTPQSNVSGEEEMEFKKPTLSAKLIRRAPIYQDAARVDVDDACTADLTDSIYISRDPSMVEEPENNDPYEFDEESIIDGMIGDEDDLPIDLPRVVHNSKKKTSQKNCDKKAKMQTVYPCSKCLYIGSNTHNLERHMLIHMDPQEVEWHTCDKCDYKTKYKYALKNHFEVHNEEKKIFSCHLCNYKVHRKQNLNKHIYSSHYIAKEKPVYECYDCGKRFNEKPKLTFHMNNLHSNSCEKCQYCNFVTVTKAALAAHVRNKHIEPERMYFCQQCSFETKFPRDLDKHILRMHNRDKMKKYDCVNCSFSTIYKSNMRYHMTHVHNSNADDKTPRQFICGYCMKVCNNKMALKSHIWQRHMTLTDDALFKCDKCPYKCKVNRNLKRHMFLKHEQKGNKCNLCDFTTTRTNSMMAHMVAHKNEKKSKIYRCDECVYIAYTMSTMIYHMKKFHNKIVSNLELQKFLT